MFQTHHTTFTGAASAELGGEVGAQQPGQRRTRRRQQEPVGREAPSPRHQDDVCVRLRVQEPLQAVLVAAGRHVYLGYARLGRTVRRLRHKHTGDYSVLVLDLTRSK